MIVSSFDPSTADVVFVGGGPVALWTAVQTKLQNPKLNVVVLEKYADYQRIHNLFIESASLKTNCNSPQLDDLVKSLKEHRVVSTKTLENSLAELAEKVGVVIQRKVEILNPQSDLKPFSNARIIVGADGAHSIMRQYIVGEPADKCFKTQKDLHYVADLTYAEARDPVDIFTKSSINSTVGNFIYEIHSKKSQKTTLRTFISADVYEKMKHATRKTPKSLYSEGVEETVRQEYLTFLKSKYKNELDACIDLKNATVTTTILGSYVSKKMVREEGGRTWCLVGDAAFGVPFFRSLNNGFISGTRLAQTIAASFEQKEDKVLSSWKTEPSFENYEAYMHKFATWQVGLADVKSFGVIKIAKMFQTISYSSRYLKASYSSEELS